VAPPPGLVRQLAAWGPVVLWMAVIAWLSGDQFSDRQTAAWLAGVPFVAALGLSPAAIDTANLILRKSAHFVEYAALATLTYRALGVGATRRSRWARLLGALLLAVGFASLDEVHQRFTLTRTGTARDVVVDALGATAGALVGGLLLVRRRTPSGAAVAAAEPRRRRPRPSSDAAPSS
jgi:VanZ family protein